MHPENELILYHYGELSPDKAKEVQAHLEGCAGCRGRLEMMKKASACVNESAIEPPKAVLDAVKAAARKETIEIAPTIPLPRGIKTFPRFKWAFAGALASILAVSLYFTGREDSPVSVDLLGTGSPSPEAEGAGQFAWNDSIEEEIETLDCELDEFRMESESIYAWSSFDLEYSGIESDGESVENSIKWREL